MISDLYFGFGERSETVMIFCSSFIPDLTMTSMEEIDWAILVITTFFRTDIGMGLSVESRHDVKLCLLHVLLITNP